MCGIAGILNFNPVDNVQLNQLKNITNPLNHRGPDANGVYKGIINNSNMNRRIIKNELIKIKDFFI